MDTIIKVTEITEINISELERQRDDYLAMAEDIHFIDIDKSLSEEIQDVVNERNSELELQQADMIEQARIISEELATYG